MPTEISITRWTWEEAFNKFGFDDGNDPESENRTEAVAESLYALNCDSVEASRWGMHNYVINSLMHQGTLYEFDGHTNPATVLPPEIVAALDKEYEDDSTVYLVRFHTVGTVYGPFESKDSITHWADSRGIEPREYSITFLTDPAIVQAKETA